MSIFTVSCKGLHENRGIGASICLRRPLHHLTSDTILISVAAERAAWPLFT